MEEKKDPKPGTIVFTEVSEAQFARSQDPQPQKKHLPETPPAPPKPPVLIPTVPMVPAAPHLPQPAPLGTFGPPPFPPGTEEPREADPLRARLKNHVGGHTVRVPTAAEISIEWLQYSTLMFAGFAPRLTSADFVDIRARGLWPGNIDTPAKAAELKAQFDKMLKIRNIFIDEDIISTAFKIRTFIYDCLFCRFQNTKWHENPPTTFAIMQRYLMQALFPKFEASIQEFVKYMCSAAEYPEFTDSFSEVLDAFYENYTFSQPPSGYYAAHIEERKKENERRKKEEEEEEKKEAEKEEARKRLELAPVVLAADQGKKPLPRPDTPPPKPPAPVPTTPPPKAPTPWTNSPILLRTPPSVGILRTPPTSPEKKCKVCHVGAVWGLSSSSGMCLRCNMDAGNPV